MPQFHRELLEVKFSWSNTLQELSAGVGEVFQEKTWQFSMSYDPITLNSYTFSGLSSSKYLKKKILKVAELFLIPMFCLPFSSKTLDPLVTRNHNT